MVNIENGIRKYELNCATFAHEGFRYRDFLGHINQPISIVRFYYQNYWPHQTSWDPKDQQPMEEDIAITTTRLVTFVQKYNLINGKDIPLYNQNPYISCHQVQGEREKQVPLSNGKITIKYVPLSLNHDERKSMLKEQGAKLVSPVN